MKPLMFEGANVINTRQSLSGTYVNLCVFVCVSSLPAPLMYTKPPFYMSRPPAHLRNSVASMLLELYIPRTLEVQS